MRRLPGLHLLDIPNGPIIFIFSHAVKVTTWHFLTAFNFFPMFMHISNFRNFSSWLHSHFKSSVFLPFLIYFHFHYSHTYITHFLHILYTLLTFSFLCTLIFLFFSFFLLLFPACSHMHSLYYTSYFFSSFSFSHIFSGFINFTLISAPFPSLLLHSPVTIHLSIYIRWSLLITIHI